MAIIDIADTSLEYSEQGGGEPLLLVHGSASDYRTWQLQQDEFAKQFHVINYSRRYHWPNEPITEGCDYAMMQHVDDLQALLQSLDATPAHLVGHSYGAFLCLLLAIKNPHMVRSLVLAEPPVITLFVSNTPQPLELLKVLATRPRTAAAIVKFGAKGVVPASKALQQGNTEAAVRIFGNAVFGPGGYQNFSALRKKQVSANLANIKAELLGSGFAPLDAAQVGRVQIPVLLVTGQNSIPLFRHLIDRLEELLPQTQRVEIPAALHAMHEDNALAYNSAVLSFLKNHRTAASH